MAGRVELVADMAIQVENLGKEGRIDGRQSDYQTIRGESPGYGPGALPAGRKTAAGAGL